MTSSLTPSVQDSVRRALRILACASIGLLTSIGAVAADTPASDGNKRFGTVWRIRGDVAAIRGDGASEQKLKEGDPVFVGDRVRAAPAGEAVLKTEDAGVVAVRPGAEFVAERFAAEGKPTDNFTVRLISGSLRLISGWIGRLNRDGHKVVTPQATIGIRGTDHEPYVLTAELAKAAASREGTYDKVNRGGTTLDANGQKLDVDPGKVGFAPRQFKQRALMTVLMPVLLEKVPNFYVPGEFDGELDRYSQTADVESQRLLDQKHKPVSAPVVQCAPAGIAKSWLGQLDKAVQGHDAKGIVAMFAPEVAVKATVRDGEGGMATVELGREELAQSTVAAMKDLKGYKQRRVSIDAKQADDACDKISVKSVVIEQGRQGGKPYRFESVEEFLLEQRAGTWLAVKAETTQR